MNIRVYGRVSGPGVRHWRTLTPRQVRNDTRRDYGALPTDHARPTTRGQCEPGGALYARPCPYMGCQYHLWVELTADGGIQFPSTVLDADGELRPEAWHVSSCALDVADRGGSTLEVISVGLSLTRERVRQIERKGLRDLKRNARRLGVKLLEEMEP